ncbi:hypothetical protein Cgig2_009335 [Carnegiea gigantea]|uniref:Uncharacterized protein n=1 Tax=Carnegiea gigantea TaxID=171969 RepID=A0A9Q1JK34_9CARY|nr:hypothetical protein Cgig2_009335 [Carnegiea gigantea]
MAETEVPNVKESEVHVFSSSAELIEKLNEKRNAVVDQPYPAMYSSIFGGIVLNPAMMMIPIDDHMVHRGHGVFDTAILFNGYLYELDTHLDRFVRSASLAKISLPFPRSTLRSILLQLTAVSKCKKGELQYWPSAGPGDFHLSPSGCPASAFYAIVIKEDFSQWKDGVRAVTSSVPMKTPLFATMKTVNYLPNVLSQMEAEEKGTFASIWVDDNGYIAEGPNMNVALINHDRELIMPPFDNILGGCTAMRLLTLAHWLVGEGRLKDVKTANVSVEEGKSSAEMMFVGSYQ